MLVASQPFLEYVSTRIGPARYELYQNIQLQESNKFLKTIDFPANYSLFRPKKVSACDNNRKKFLWYNKLFINFTSNKCSRTQSFIKIFAIN